jgi:hypothetical protein
MFEQKIKSRDECFQAIVEYFSPTITFIRDESLAEKIPTRKLEDEWKLLNNEEWERQPDDEDHMQYFGLEIVGRNTIKYCQATGVHGLIHEAAHFLLAKQCWDIDKHGADLYRFCHDLPEQGHPYAQMEEMCVEFIGYQILDKLNIVFDALIHDQISRDSSGQLKPLDLTPVGDYLEDDVVPELFMKGDIDFSPIYMYKVANCSGDLFENIRNNPLFTLYGHEFFRLCGCMDEDRNIIGTLNPELVRRNKDAIAKIFKIKPPHDQEFIDFICL